MEVTEQKFNRDFLSVGSESLDLTVLKLKVFE